MIFKLNLDLNNDEIRLLYFLILSSENYKKLDINSFMNWVNVININMIKLRLTIIKKKKIY
jgi:hypothetical protein